MKTLYIVTMYSFRQNVFTRWALTADNFKAAEKDAKECMSDGWRIHSCVSVCKTPDAVCLEL